MKKNYKIIIIILFIIFLAFLLYLTLFKNFLGRTVGNYEPNVIPFRNIFTIIKEYMNHEVSFRFYMRNIFGNIIAFLPFAIFIKIIFKLDNVETIIFSFIFIVFIETMQLITRMGYFDIDDIILNTLGTFPVVYITKLKILKKLSF